MSKNEVSNLKESVLILPEQATVENIQNIFSDLKNHVELNDSIVIDFTQVATADLTLIQLLYAGFKTCMEKNKFLSFKGIVKPEVVDVFVYTGFLGKHENDCSQWLDSLIYLNEEA